MPLLRWRVGQSHRGLRVQGQWYVHAMSVDVVDNKVHKGAHFHRDEQGFLHACYHKCPSWLKIIAVSGAMNLFWEFATFLPVHRFYEHMHWIH